VSIDGDSVRKESRMKKQTKSNTKTKRAPVKPRKKKAERSPKTPAPKPCSEDTSTGPVKNLWGHNGRWDEEDGEDVWLMESADDGTEKEHACGLGMLHKIKKSNIVLGPVRQGRCNQYPEDIDVIWTLDCK
jgi:hypothetical protein